MKKKAMDNGEAERVEKACDLLMDCLEINNISKSTGVSAMASIITTILSEYEPVYIKSMMQMMIDAYNEKKAMQAKI